MSENTSQVTKELPSDDLSRLLAASAVPSPVPSQDQPPQDRRSLRRKLVVGLLIAGIGVGASFMSCVGQSFSLRQARALEGIEQQFLLLRQSCVIDHSAHPVVAP